jgi:hypothetical protein
MGGERPSEEAVFSTAGWQTRRYRRVKKSPMKTEARH